MGPTVAVLGGGVAGLSAAQELTERGFDVTVYERNDRFGGKARSMPVPGTEGSGPPLPGEHGFRFFPGFYRHVTDTMARIPYGNEGRTVFDNLVPTTRMLQIRDGGEYEEIPVETLRNVGKWRTALRTLFARDRVPVAESNFFADRLLTFLTSSEARRREEYEQLSWWEFIDAEHRSKAYQQFLGYGVTQLLVAMRPQVSSTRTIGRIYLQLLGGLFDRNFRADTILAGPTNDVWIDPWTTYLESLGVDLRTNATVQEIACDGERVTGVVIEVGEETTEIMADYYVAAIPAEAKARLLTEDLLAADPSLAGITKLETAWMSGLQFYLREDVPAVHGHLVFFNSPWALTAISQRQFWSEFDLDACGDGEVEGILSVIISEWDEPGIRYGKPARECTPEEIIAETIAQMNAGFPEELLTAENVVEWFLDPALVVGEDGDLSNREPLLVNTVGSLQYRPEAGTDIENLVLAADYVRTNTDLASMEGANEAARRATNAILSRSGIFARPCEVWNLEEPRIFEPLKSQDAVGYRLGLPHPGRVGTPLWRAGLGVWS